jgi:predicted amidohydrolase
VLTIKVTFSNPWSKLPRTSNLHLQALPGCGLSQPLKNINCYVAVGYPEKTNSTSGSAAVEYYNSAVTVSPDGETIANYRKSFLYYTDDTWAAEGTGFYSGEISNLGKIAMGICKLHILLIELILKLNI